MKTRIGKIIFPVIMVALLAAKGNPPPEEPATVVVPAPIDGAMVAAPATSDGEYTLNITSGLPSGCVQFDEFRMEGDGNEFMVDVTNLMPNPNQLIACTAIYSYHESEIPLGSGLTAGEAYSNHQPRPGGLLCGPG